MKNRIFFLIPVSTLVFLFTQVGVFAAGPSLNLVLSSQNPYPVEPGNIADIEVELQNTGTGDASDITLKIEPADPFTLVPGEDEIKTFSRITASDSVKTTYKLHVDRSAISSDYDLGFRYYMEDPSVSVLQKLVVTVQGKPKLVLKNLETEPEEIEPGDLVRVTANLENVGTGNAYHLETTLNSTSSFIVPELSGGTYYVGEIKAKETKNAIFDLAIDNSAEYMTYSSKLTLTYKDDTNTETTTTFDLGIPIRGKPIIEILNTKVENSDLKVDIENIGTANAKALKINFIQDGDVKDTAIANELKPTKHKTFRFRGFRYGQATINITYLDEGNMEYTKGTQITIKKSVFAEEGKDQGLSFLAPILIVILVLESFYIWRLRKRKK